MIKRILAILACLAAGAYLLAAITVLNVPSGDDVCRDVTIYVKDSTNAGFINTDEVRATLLRSKLFPVGQKQEKINTMLMEEKLMENPFISSADCYRTASSKIRIEIEQRLPILRLMSSAGENCYIDEMGHVMRPQKSTYAAHLPVVTGYASTQFVTSRIVPLGMILKQDEFWKDMIVQINITSDQKVELIPRVGQHVIFLGDAEKYTEKLNRLKLFYEIGLKQIGWNKYSRISLEFGNQIICTKK